MLRWERSSKEYYQPGGGQQLQPGGGGELTPAGPVRRNPGIGEIVFHSHQVSHSLLHQFPGSQVLLSATNLYSLLHCHYPLLCIMRLNISLKGLAHNLKNLIKVKAVIIQYSTLTKLYFAACVCHCCSPGYSPTDPACSACYTWWPPPFC